MALKRSSCFPLWNDLFSCMLCVMCIVCWWINDRVLFFICFFFLHLSVFFLLLFLFFHFAKLCCLLAHRWTLNCAKCIQTYWSLDEHWMKFKRPTRIYISKALHDMNEKHEENHDRRKTHTTERRTNNNNKLETLVCKLNWLCHAKHVLHIYTQKYSVRIFHERMCFQP